MRLALAFALLAACSGSSKSSDGKTTLTTTDGTSSPDGTPTTTATTTATPAPTTTTSTTTTTTTSTSSKPATTAKPAATTAGGKPLYSCFSYLAKNSAKKRHACMRTDDCGPYLEQMKTVPGIRDVTGCASVPAVFCFHQVATKEEPEGLDVCQPTLDECKAARADVVKAKMSVDTDCGQK